MEGNDNRWVFRQDDSCHWYLIPLNKNKLFSDLMEQSIEEENNSSNYAYVPYEDSAESKFNDEFSQYRTGGGIDYSFTDPKEIN